MYKQLNETKVGRGILRKVCLTLGNKAI